MARDTTQIGTPLSEGDAPTNLSRHVRGLKVSRENLNHVAAAIQVRNASGGPYTKGQLVYQSGFHAATDTPEITIADADSALSRPTHVLTEAIADGANGLAAEAAVIDGLATNGRTIGDLVYMSGTAGGFVFAAVSGAGQFSQVVGIVMKVDASDGWIRFFPGLAIMQLTAELQALSVGAAEITDDSIDETKMDMSLSVSIPLPFTLGNRSGPASDGVLVGVLDATDATDVLQEDSSGGPSFIDETADAASAAANDVAVPDPFDTGDALYIGFTTKFHLLSIQVGTQGSGAAVEAETLWEYWNGSAWTDLEAVEGFLDSSAALTAGTSTYFITFVPPSDWAVTTVDGGPSNFFIRMRATANDVYNTTQAIVTRIQVFPLAAGQGITIPQAGTITAVDLASFVASATNDDTELLLINVTQGTFAQLTWTGADVMDRVTGLSLAVTAGDSLVVAMVTEDGTTEFATGSLTLQVDF